MKHILMTGLALVLAVSAACSKGGGASGPVGKWTIDSASLEKMMMDEAKKNIPADSPADVMKMATDQVKKMAAEMKVSAELKSGGDYVATMSMPGMPGSDAKSSTSKGTWKLDGDKLTMTSTEEDGKKKDPPEVKTATYKGSTIEIPIPNGPTFVLKRA